jgi:hypothetical protein
MKRFMLMLTVVMSCLLLNVSVPDVQAQTGTVELVGQIGGNTESVFVEGDYAYIGEGPRLTILDISNPANPIVIGKSAPLPGVVQDIQVSGSCTDQYP